MPNNSTATLKDFQIKWISTDLHDNWRTFLCSLLGDLGEFSKLKARIWRLLQTQ